MNLGAITIWDSTQEPSDKEGLIYFWNGYRGDVKTYSILSYIEKNRNRLRDKYLKWILDLGGGELNGKKLIDHLEYEGNLSYWWETLFVEQSPWKTPSIMQAIRIFALEEILISERPNCLNLATSSESLSVVIAQLCGKLNITFKRIDGQHNLSIDFRGRLLKLIPYHLQGLIYLLGYIIFLWPFKKSFQNYPQCADKSVFICSYFDNFDSKDAANGHFVSYYWGPLQALLDELGFKSSWLQIFVPGLNDIKKRTAIKLTNGFNLNWGQEGFHVFVEAFFSFKLWRKVLKQWIRLIYFHNKIGNPNKLFMPKNSLFSLWPMMRSDWSNALVGPEAIKTLLWIELFDIAMKKLPKQQIGFYLCENQAWERAFIYAWKKHGHGRLVGVAHSTVRFWDLRYFTDYRVNNLKLKMPCPQPDYMALNGDVAVRAFKESGYPVGGIFECEALRYGYLNNFPPKKTEKKIEIYEVLIMGDISPSSTRKLLRCIELSIDKLNIRLNLSFKSHPNCILNHTDYPLLRLNMINKPLGEIMSKYDFALSSNQTSAAVDAFLCNIPLAVMYDDTSLNFSPLIGLKGVDFFGSPDQLIQILCADNMNRQRNNANQFFFLDGELPKWRDFLMRDYADCCTS